jgi:hypothetical protein
MSRALTPREFATLAEEIAPTIPRVVHWEIRGYEVTVTVTSNSRKLRYDESFRYDPELSTVVAITRSYPGSAIGIIFRRRLTELTAEFLRNNAPSSE